MVASTRQLAVPEALVAAFESFTQRHITLEELHAVVARIVSADPAYVEVIQSMFDHELENQRLTIADYGELVVELGEVLSEDVATDCSALNPDESGVYRIVAPGQMVPDETNVEPLLDAEPDPGEESASESGETTGELPLLTDVVAEHSEPEAQARGAEPGPGTLLRDRFRLEEQLGSGSMGTIFRATDLLLEESGVADPYLAVKVIKPELAGNPGALRALQNEIIASQRLSHPNIIHIHDFDRDGDISFVTMELLKGRTLASLLDEESPNPLDSVLADRIIQQLGDALAYAHRQGVVHADLKPGNVFLCDSGELKLLDFGLAQMGHALRDDEALLKGVLTPAYASCERLEHRKASPQDDIYSFGCIAYRMLVGSRPFSDLTALEAEARQKKLLPNAAIPRHRFPVLRDALAFRAGNRTATISSFIEHYFAPDMVEAAEEPPVLTAKPESSFDAVDASERSGSKPVAEDLPTIDQSTARQAVPQPQPEAVVEPVPVTEPEEPPRQSAEPTPERKRFVRSRKRAKELAERPELTARTTARDMLSNESRVRAWRRKAVLTLHGIGYRLTTNQARFAVFGLGCVAVAALLVTLGLESSPTESVAEAEPNQAAQLPEPTTHAMVVVPTEESVLVIPPDFYARAEPAPSASQPQRQTPRRPRRTEREPGAITVITEPAEGPTIVTEDPVTPLVSPPPVAEVAVGGVATQVAPDPFPLSVVTDVDTSARSAAVVTDVASNARSPDSQGDYVTDVAPQSAPGEASGVVTTVGARRPAQSQQRVGSRTPNPDPDAPLPLSALEFSRYIEPEFPELRGQEAGWVDVSFSVDERGRTGDVEVTDSSLPRRFNRAALNAVKRWRFEPYQRNGTAIAVDSAVRLRVE